jgi:hypothetical protein
MLTNAGFLARIRDRAQRVKDPSQCTPDRETAFNNADNIERQLQEDGHKIWSWVIYRCTYKSNEEWALSMDHFRYYSRSTLRYDNALDMQTSLDHHVFEVVLVVYISTMPIPAQFASLSCSGRQPQQEQEQGEGKHPGRSQRYKYGIHADQDSLQSVINQPAPPADNPDNGFVNLVCLTILGGMRPEHTSGRDEQDHRGCVSRTKI